MTAVATIFALRDAGDFPAAQTAALDALLDDPTSSPLHNALGTVHVLQGNNDAALQAFDAAVQSDRSNIDAVLNLAEGCAFVGRYAEAVTMFRHALTLRPDDGTIYNRLGQAQHGTGATADAEVSLRRAVELGTDLAEAHYNLGVLLNARVENTEALIHAEKAIELVPTFNHAHNLRGVILADLGRFQDAIAAHEEAVRLAPDIGEPHNNLGRIYHMLGQPMKSIEHCQEAIRIKPKSDAAYVNLGSALELMAKWNAAILSYRHALILNPNNPGAWNNMASCLRELGRMDEAHAAYRKAFELSPIAMVESNLIYVLDQDARTTVEESQASRRAWYQRHRLPNPHTTWANDRGPDRQLRVGYVSADFRRHSAAYTFSPVLWGHDRDRYEVWCYSSTTVRDDMMQEFISRADQWRDVQGITDERLAEMVREDQIDILVDLSGNTAGNRLKAFTLHPAPVQVSAWAGPGTGIPEMDYLLSDPIIIPQDQRHLFAETVYDLPCAFTYRPQRGIEDVSPLPALTNGYITFGCFNRLSKIGDACFALWGRLLRELPDARLLLKDKALTDPKHAETTWTRFEREGIDSDRVKFLGLTSHLEHVGSCRLIDIALDPFPQNGGVTTLEMLWMGVPIVTKLGAVPPARVAGSILSALGLRDLVAEDDDGYIRAAKRLASGRWDDLLRPMREELRGRLRFSPIANTNMLVDEVETAYRTMWKAWCAR